MTARAPAYRAAARHLAITLGACTLAAPATLPAQAPVSDRGDLTERVERLERVMNTGTLVDLLERVERLQTEVRDLRGQLEVQNHETGQLKQRQRELYLDLDGRLQQMEQGGAPPVAGGGIVSGAQSEAPADATGAESQASSSASVETDGPVADPLAEQADYQAAFNLLKEARYDDAAAALEEFLQDYPDGAYADNAQYWLGESYYVTRKFPAALTEFETLVAKFPSSQKYTHAMLKIGYIHDELGRQGDARRVLEELVSRHPGSAAAGLAKKRLERLQ